MASVVPVMARVWDIGDPEPVDVVEVTDQIADGGDEDSPRWGRTVSGGGWKGYKDGGKVYLEWPELVRRWGPVTDAARKSR